MYGVALEGGGARGAYHIGAIKALIENGYKISAVVGTSIGALNAAIVAQGDFDKLYKYWINITSTDLFDINAEDVSKLVNRKVDMSLIKKIAEYVKEATINKGIDTTKYKEIIDALIDEKKLRKSKVDYGLVTVSLTDRKPLELYKEDIQEGMISSYIMASSYLPVFKSEKIQDKVFIDGGFYNNCPIDMLLKKGYKDIIEIRTKAIGLYRKIKTDKDVNIISISPSESLGSILLVDKEVINKNIKMGYYDALRVIKKLKGRKYYINDLNKNVAFDIFDKLTDDQIFKIAKNSIKFSNDKEAKKLLFETILPEMAKKIKLLKANSYDELLIGIVEYLLSEEDLVNKYDIYDLKQLILELKRNSTRILKKEIVLKNPIKTMMIKLIKEINIENM